MQRSRIVSVVEDTWGCSVMYSDEPDQGQGSIDLPSRTKLMASKISIHDLDTNNDYEYEQNYTEEKQIMIDNSLKYLQASLFATILEDTLMELRILVQCNNELRVIKAHIDMSMLIVEKFEISQPESNDELEGIDPHTLECNDYKLKKLESDRKYIMDAIVMLYKDLTMYQTFVVLQDYINVIVKKENDIIALIEDEDKNKLLRRELNKQLRQHRNHMKSLVYDADATIDELKNQVEDASLNAAIHSRYVDNWQRARTEQHLKTIDDKEVKPSTIIEYYKQRTDYEQRVHSEVELLTNIFINETLEKVERWMEKYDKDMEKLDLKIQIKKNDYQNMLDKRIDFENTIQKHDIMMKEWIHFKEEREKARLYHEKMTNSAIIVQAWWRGLLVRRQLGPFKVPKKKGGALGKKK